MSPWERALDSLMLLPILKSSKSFLSLLGPQQQSDYYSLKAQYVATGDPVHVTNYPLAQGPSVTSPATSPLANLYFKPRPAYTGEPNGLVGQYFSVSGPNATTIQGYYTLGQRLYMPGVPIVHGAPVEAQLENPLYVPATTKLRDVLGAVKDPFGDVKVGDLVRIGGPSTHGFTDYLTVVEKSDVDAVYNATDSTVPLMISGINASTLAAGASLVFNSYADQTYSQAAVAFETPSAKRPLTALRLNHSLNATTMRRNIDAELKRRTIPAGEPTDATTAHEATLAQRHLVTTWSGEQTAIA